MLITAAFIVLVFGYSLVSRRLESTPLTAPLLFTAAGVLMAIHPAVGGATLLTWLIIAFFFRLSSLAALVSAVFAPLWYGLLFGVDAIALAIALMSALLIWRHRANIANLMAGRESRIGQKKA